MGKVEILLESGGGKVTAGREGNNVSMSGVWGR